VTRADRLTVSRFTSKIAPPTRLATSWQELAALFSDPCRTPCTVATCRGSACVHKEGGCWSPAVFSGSRRARQDVEAISCLVIDVDHATEAAVDALRGKIADYQHVLHTTHADRQDDRRMRVVVQLTRPVAVGEWPQFWRAAALLLDAPADPSCGDVARCYYLPSRPRDADYFVAEHAGVALDVDAVLASAAALHGATAQAAAQEGASA
jgi:hypothetical protein